jgi:hypothetical protein
MKRLALVVWFAAMAFPGSATAAAEINKWIDAEGQVHYGDVPPSGTNATPLRVQPNVIETDQRATPPVNDELLERPDAPAKAKSIAAPDPGQDIQSYVERCRDNRGVDCEREAIEMIDGPAPLIFPGDPAVFPRPDVTPPPPGLPLKYGIRP